MNSFGAHLFLLVNLGKELSQFFELKEKGETESARAVSARAHSIIDSLLTHPNLSSGGKWEMEKWREIIEDALSDKPKFLIKKADADNYFRPFGATVLSV